MGDPTKHEIEIEAHPVATFSAGTNYIFLKRKNISNADVKCLDTRERRIVLYASVFPLSHIDVTASMEYDVTQYSANDSLYTAGPFAL